MLSSNEEKMKQPMLNAAPFDGVFILSYGYHLLLFTDWVGEIMGFSIET